MGYSFNGVCYPTVEQAKVEQCSQFGQIWGSTTTYYTAECSAVLPTGLNICHRTNGGACKNSTLPFQTYQSCDHDGGVNMSLEYFGLILGFVVIVYVAARLKDYFWGKHEGL